MRKCVFTIYKTGKTNRIVKLQRLPSSLRHYTVPTAKIDEPQHEITNNVAKTMSSAKRDLRRRHLSAHLLEPIINQHTKSRIVNVPKRHL